LYVDDSPDDTFLMEKAWKKSASPLVRLATLPGGRAALRHLHEQARAGELPDLLLIDLKMPEVSGIEVLRHMKEDATLAGVCALVLSSSRLSADVAEADRAGAVACLTKPVEYRQVCVLVERLSAWVAGGMHTAQLATLEAFRLP
jgi:CheY-like chemotaxis protein